MFVLQNTHTGDERLGNMLHGLPGGGASWGSTDLRTYGGVERRAAVHDMTLVASEAPDGSGGGGGIHFEMLYSTELFVKESVDSHLAHMGQLLDHLTASDWHSETAALVPLSRLPLLTSHESDCLHRSFQGKVVAFASVTSCLSDLLHKRITSDPTRVAVCDDNHSYTYAELGARSGVLANLVRSELSAAVEAVVVSRVGFERTEA